MSFSIFNKFRNKIKAITMIDPDAEQTWEQYISARQTHLKSIQQTRDIDRDTIIRALTIVRNFLIERKLLIYGGLAVDYALRIHGDQIYPDTELPDYDMFSANSIQDAYDLADLLQTSGYENVSAFRRMHVQTMGVRVDFNNVADISYMPQTVLDRVKTIDYKGITCVHPHFQMIDMHSALSLPFSNAPRETIFHRWKKDLERYNRLFAVYPINFPVPKTELKQVRIPIVPHVAIHGFLAFNLICEAFNVATTSATIPDHLRASSNPAMSAGIKEEIQTSWDLKFDVTPMETTPQSITCHVPDFMSVTLLSTRIQDAAKLLQTTTRQKPKWFRPYLDMVPERFSIDETGAQPNIMVYANEGCLVSCFRRVDIPMDIIAVQGVLQQFLAMAHITGDERYLGYYTVLLDVIRAADSVFRLEVPNKLEKGASRNHIMAAPFFLSTTTFGERNESESQRIFHQQLLADIGAGPELAGVPQNYEPGQTRPDVTMTSKYFAIDGIRDVAK